MDLLPICVGLSEGSVQAKELFLIDPSKYSSSYFLSTIFMALSLQVDKEDTTLSEESTLAWMHREIENQIKKYEVDILSFLRHSPDRRIEVYLNFHVEGALRIEDSIAFSFPLGRTPEKYAEDLFMFYRIPGDELLLLFTFYIREEILNQIRRSTHASEQMQRTPQSSPKEEFPKVSLSSQERISSMAFVYEGAGKISVTKTTKKDKKKKISINIY
ncbi:hypothetical protein NEFER03_1979 [Nematocida sp. LUAm3]|nr:hypothetical protein NEFER03_1979 [Nematocida sp. LUAm3]KAI5176063.1 hypothetical protein NEFER02_1897 [Nematocida sp. LUAm2]KAI5177107.1 hypothetical protein NEFER01_0382 [Nematocida sp. LUAm1]